MAHDNRDDDTYPHGYGGRRESDLPGVSLRHHVEMLVNQWAGRLEGEIIELRGDVQELQKRIHRFRGDLAGLHEAQSRNEGARAERERQRLSEQENASRTQAWIQWVPTLVMMLLALYIALNPSG